MNFSDKVNNLITDFYKTNLIKPNELWLGYKEIAELENFVNTSYSSNYNKIYLMDLRVKFEFLGLKIRQKDVNSYFTVEYNQYYDK